MWIDSASKIDMLAYYPYAELLMDIIEDKRMQPLTIGLFGSWGIGKSTLINLIENKISNSDEESRLYYITLNAWSFESYDDAKTAIMESLLKAIESNKSFKDKAGEKIKTLLSRVNYLKLAAGVVKAGIPLALSVATANPAPILLSVSKTAWDNMIKKPEESIQKIYDEAASFKGEYLKDIDEKSVVENIRLFKSEFNEVIQDIGVKNLVVMIDDLDRCNPDRIIDILEAIKLFLTVDHTTFIIAVDERVVKYAIKDKFPMQTDDSTDISKDYIEKIIQLPIRLPELSSVDIENYLLLLVYELFLQDSFSNIVENLYDDGSIFSQQLLTAEKLDTICGTLSYEKEELKKLRVTIEKIKSVIADSLKGNPRQAKRFLNMFLIRKRLAGIYYKGEGAIRDDILAKLMALEYIDKDRFQEIYRWYKESTVGTEKLKILYEIVATGKTIEGEFSSWNKDTLKRWVMTEPVDIFDKELEKYFYISRDVLKEKVHSLDTLTIQDREEIAYLIENKADVAIQRKKISEITLFETERKKNIYGVIYELFSKRTLGMVTINLLFDNEESERYEIGKLIEKLEKKDIKAADIGFIRHMYQKEPKALEMAINKLKEKNSITEDHFQTITGNRQGGI